MSGAAFVSAWEPLPAGAIAFWAMIGVFAAVVIVRLRDGDFGVGVGAALMAIGIAALVLLCAVLRRTSYYDAHDVIRSAHGKVSLSGFQDAVPREGGGGQDRHRQLRAGRR
jgi:hypothetical protein